MNNHYFSLPTQVKFINPAKISLEEKSVVIEGGIAYKDEIICGEDGTVLHIPTLTQSFNEIAQECVWLQGFLPIESYVHWVDLEEAILSNIESN